MKFPSALLLFILTALLGCRDSLRDPQAFLDAVMRGSHSFQDGPLEYKLNLLPVDYFVARDLLAHPEGRDRGLEKLRAEARHDFGGGTFFLLRIDLDSLSRDSESAKDQLSQKMHILQIGQEAGRLSITAHLNDGQSVHPDVYLAQSDWISQSGFSVLFCIKGKASDISRIEFTNNIVVNRNQEVEIRGFRSASRLEG